MFRIVFQCDDRKLADALRGLTGIAIGSPEVLPVINGALKNGKVVAKNDGKIEDLFLDYAKKLHLTTFSHETLRDFCRHLGRPETTAHYYAKQLVTKGVLKKSNGGKGKGVKVSYAVVKA
jgi:hypothetical protein